MSLPPEPGDAAAMSMTSQAIFRANPGYELVPAGRLTWDERRRHQLADDFYGILRPRPGSGLDARACPPDTALLFLTLALPGPLPSYARSGLTQDGGRPLARLVADGVLEVMAADGFVSGLAAGLVLPGRAGDDLAAGGRGRVGDLTVAALRYGQALAGVPAEVLASRLYLYGTRPTSPRLRSRLPDEAAVWEYLGIGPGGPARRALADGWREGPAPPGRPSPWRYWVPGPSRGHTSPATARAGFKLYVSPSEEAVPAAVAAVVTSLAASPGVTGFKVARDLAGICRPDKVVVYFARLDDLQAGAFVMARELAGAEAHGVPFTAAVTADGLLSWATDPPAGSVPQSSWRMWVAERLADYLLQALRQAGSPGPGAARGDTEPWQLALQRLRLDGIDTDTWIPASGIWREALDTS